MRKIIVSLHATLDNVVSDPEKWMIMDDELLEKAINYYDSLDAAIFGSKTYPFLAKYWQEAEKSSTSESERRFAKKINNIKKYVVSRSPVDLVWANSQQLTFTDISSFSKVIDELKNQGDKNISVDSGLGIWQLFLDNMLFDELIINVQPVIVGQGEKLFSSSANFTRLNLKSARPFLNGVIELKYERIK